MKAHPALTQEHEAFRETMRRFVAKEISPRAAEWDEAGEFPREMYRKAAAAGLLGLGFPEAYGGMPADLLMHVVLSEEIALGGAGFVRGTRAERVYREVKVMTIGGGAEEIMKDLAARQLGWQ